MWARRLHIYTSMALLLVVLFFTVTGITLNRAEHFVGTARVDEQQILVPESTLFKTGSIKINRESLIEFLRQSADVKGFASELDVYTEFHQGELELGEVTMSFKAPGYSAAVFIDMTNRVANIEQRDYGVIALLNDAHKGRNCGPIWHAFIDITAILMTVFILTGFILIMPKRRTFILSVKWMTAGSIAAGMFYYLAIP